MSSCPTINLISA